MNVDCEFKLLDRNRYFVFYIMMRKVMRRIIGKVMGKGFAVMLGFALLGSVAVSCSQGEDIIKGIDIAKALESKKVEINLSELASSLEYIPLDMGDDFFPSNRIMRMIPTQDAIHFVPMMFSDSHLYRFSRDGKLISKFSKVGRAAGEYLHPISTVYDKANNRYYILTGGSSVKIYTVDGEYITSFSGKLPGYNGAFDMQYVGGKVKFFARSKDFRRLSALELDDTGKIISEDVILDYGNLADDIFKDNLSLRVSTELKTNYSGKPLLLHHAIDSIYSYSGIAPSKVEYFVNFGNYKDGIERKINVGGFCSETPNHLILQTVMSLKHFDNLDPSERINYILFDKRTGESVSLVKDANNNSYFKNDIDGGMPFFPTVVSEDKMYQLVDAITFIEQAELSTCQAMKNIAKNLTEESNPVIVVATLK